MVAMVVIISSSTSLDVLCNYNLFMLSIKSDNVVLKHCGADLHLLPGVTGVKRDEAVAFVSYLFQIRTRLYGQEDLSLCRLELHGRHGVNTLTVNHQVKLVVDARVALESVICFDDGLADRIIVS